MTVSQKAPTPDPSPPLASLAWGGEQTYIRFMLTDTFGPFLMV
jgi:hypothetical protein